MKTLFAHFILFVVAIMLLSSCSNTSKLSFAKRHYRSGYFVDFCGKSYTAASPVAKVPVRARHSISAIAATKPESYGALNTSLVSSQKTDIAQKKIQESYLISITSNSTKQLLQQILNVTESPKVQNKQALSESNNEGGGSSERAALSLLWIVIVVILILWLIGFLVGGFGLGGLINLLLLIALILFILWLLRIW